MSINQQGRNLQWGTAATQGGNPFNTNSDFGNQNTRVTKQSGMDHDVLNQESYDVDRERHKGNTGMSADARLTQTASGNHSTSGLSMGTGDNTTRGVSGATSLGSDETSGFQRNANMKPQEKPSATDKIMGGVQKAAGKMTSDKGLYERGQDKSAGDSNFNQGM